MAEPLKIAETIAAALALLGGCFGLAGCEGRAVSAAGAPMHLRYASPYPPGHPFSRADIAWMRRVEQDSHGRLKIDPYWGGVTISSDESLFELRHGVADIALITPIYQRAGVRTIKTQTGFYVGADTPEQQVAVYHCLAQAFPAFDQELAGVHVLAVQGGSLAHMITRTRALRSLADLKGLRLRAPSEIAVTLKQFGVAPSTMPMAEVYSALSKGAIDGVVAPSDTLLALHFSDVARHIFMIKAARGAYPARAISDKAWRKLPPDLRAVLDKDGPFWEAMLANEVRRAEAAGASYGRNQRVEFTSTSAQDQDRFDRAEIQTASADAEKLRRIGVDGPSVLALARAFIASQHGGPPVSCRPRPDERIAATTASAVENLEIRRTDGMQIPARP